MSTARESQISAQPRTEAVAPPARAYRALYTCMLVVTYLAVMIDLFLIVITHGPAVALKSALALLVVCAGLSLVPFFLFARKARKETGRRTELHTLWNIYRLRGATSAERAFTAILFAIMMIALALIVSHGHIR